MNLKYIKFKKVECGLFTLGIGVDSQLYAWGHINTINKTSRP